MSTNKNIFEKNLLNECPHGFCDYIQSNAEVLVVILCLDGFIFFVTLLPPLFSWSKKKPDGRKRIYFAALACFTFYFWLAFLAVNSLYCFGFLAHHGPCETSKVPSNSSSMQSPRQSDSTLVSAPDPTIPTFQTLPENTGENPPTRTSRSTHAILQAAASTSSITSLLTSGPSLRPTTSSDQASATSEQMTAPPAVILATEIVTSSSSLASTDTTVQSVGVPMPLIWWSSDHQSPGDSSSSSDESSCLILADEHETQLKNLTLVNVLILVVLFIVFIANAREVMTAKPLHHKETLCKKEEVQRFLSSLVLKPPEVGHLINCFHTAKTNADTRNKKANMAATAANLKKAGKDGGPPRKVITFSAIENFNYQTWRDFSAVQLIDPSPTYPLIEVEIVLNFFPGDHFTAEKYKAFVNHMTKTHSGRDQRITIDDYFHVEDHREWTFYVGNESYIAPWYDKDAAKIPLSCIFLLGWPFRLAYGGRIAKHQVEIKKAVFVENNSADEGVSLSATPASEDAGEAAATAAPTASTSNNKPVIEVVSEKDSLQDELGQDEDIEDDDESKAMLETNPPQRPHQLTSTASSSNHEPFTEHRVNAVVSQPPKEPLLQSGSRGGEAAGSHHRPVDHHAAAVLQLQQMNSFGAASAAAASNVTGVATDPLQQTQQSHHHFYQQMQMGPSIPTTYNPATSNPRSNQLPAFGHPLAQVLPQQPALPQRSLPAQQQLLRPLREKDVLVTHNQDINGVNTVALKDMEMTNISGYETYV